MLQTSNRYSSSFERFPRIKLRYVVLPILAMAVFSMFASFQGSNTKITATKVISTLEKNIQENRAETLQKIEPASGDNNIVIKQASQTIQSNILKTSKKISHKKDVSLSKDELSLSVANTPKPAKKPFLLVENDIKSTVIKGDITKKTLKVKKGDTLGKLLERGGIGASSTYNITSALQTLYNPKDMQIGQKLTVFTKNGDFKGLDIEKNLLKTVSLRATEDGRYGVQESTAPTHTVSYVKKGLIGSSLYKAALNQNIPDNIIVEMIKIYSWAIDFQRDIQSGDKFEIMYNITMTKDNKAVPGQSTISYVKLNSKNAGEIALYRYKDTSNDTGYYETNGSSVRKALMRTPINGARLSSGFGMRKHPVLGYSKMHKGVDFAAPTGTPIYAAGDGRITYIGTKGGYGKYIKIRHHYGLDTAYAHMSRFKKGMKKGSRVKQGQTIGYVGSTGRSTGPHLHYEILSGGRQVNPRKLKMQKGKKLAGKDMEIFEGIVEQTKYQFSELLNKSYDNNQRAEAF